MFLSVNRPPRREDYIFKNIVYYAFLTVKITTMSGTQTRWQDAGPMGSHYTHKWKPEKNNREYGWSTNMRVTCIPWVRRCWLKTWPLPLSFLLLLLQHWSLQAALKWLYDREQCLRKGPPRARSWFMREKRETVTAVVSQEAVSMAPPEYSLCSRPFLEMWCLGATNPRPFRKTQQKVTEAPIYSRREGLEKERAQMFL